MKTIEIIPKIKVDSKEKLALVYTPGVAKSSNAIKEDYDKVFDLTNRSNSVAVLSFSYTESLKRAVYIKETFGADAYPFEIKKNELPFDETERKKELNFVIENIMPNFMGVDTVLMQDKPFDAPLDIPTRSKGCLFSGNINIESIDPVELRRLFGGVTETKVAEIPDNTFKKPVAIVSDGSAVLGLGNIGAEAGIPVMEGKAVLFKELGSTDAMSLCLKTQIPAEIERIVYLLENSFSGINLEDISAPRCFEIEQNLIQKLQIPVFHDDQHGTAIVVLAGLLNAMKVAGKNLEDTKIIFSGAGAAGQAICRLLIKMREFLASVNSSAKNSDDLDKKDTPKSSTKGGNGILMFDKSGAVYKGRPENDLSLEAIAEITNYENFKGSLKDGIKGADIFIGVSTKNILTQNMVKTMANNAVVFAIANPEPEILPNLALEAGALIAASGRSDFNNQINNSLVFPGLFKGILNSGVKKIDDRIKIEAALALAEIVTADKLNKNYIIPDALDKNVPLGLQKIFQHV